MNSTLENHLNCCRSCAKHLKSGMKAVEISRSIERRFFELSGINLILSDLYSNVICESCNSKLSEFCDFKNDFREYQAQLDAFVSRDEADAEESHEELFTFPEVHAFSIKREMKFSEDDEMLDEIQSDDQINNFYASEENLHEPPPPLMPKIAHYKYCELCEKNVKANCYYSHFKRHHCEAMYVCDLDNKRFKLKNDLRDHMKSHICKDDRQKFYCLSCNSSFFSTSALRNHSSYFHSGYIEEHPCECGKLFASQMKLRQHQKDVHRKHSFACEFCGKIYDSSRALRKHRENHTIGKIQCPVCGKQFYRSSMRDHLKTHDDPLFECIYQNCIKKFYSQKRLNNHLKTHNANKEFLCSDCNSTFTSQVKYERHRARQHPEVPSFCQIPGCDKQFSRKDNAIKHYKSSIHKDLDAVTRRALIDDVRTNKNISW